MSEPRLNELDEVLLGRTYEIARRSRANGNHPFGALLATSDGEVLLEAENRVRTDGDLAAHAEVNLLHAAARALSQPVIAAATMYTTAEPCAMCAATVYWVGIARVVYGLSELELGEIIGPDPENLTMHLDCRTVLAAGQRPVVVIGPVPSSEARAVHDGFWRPERPAT